jgi:hypothetical protein
VYRKKYNGKTSELNICERHLRKCRIQEIGDWNNHEW